MARSVRSKLEPRAAELTSALKAAGLRLTPQRAAVCAALAGNHTHPTAQALYDGLRAKFKSLSRATVYNTLQTLVEAGLISELGPAGDGAIHYDADPSPHVNVMCVECHRIDDLAAPVAGLAENVTRRTGFALQGARLVYYGLCPACQLDQTKAGRRPRTS